MSKVNRSGSEYFPIQHSERSGLKVMRHARWIWGQVIIQYVERAKDYLARKNYERKKLQATSSKLQA